MYPLDPLVVFKNVAKSYGKHQVIKNVSFEIFPQEVLGLLGDSGCGKSTIGKLLLGLEKPDTGTISFQGTDIHTAKGYTKKWLQREIQMVFQNPLSSLNPRMTLEQSLSEPMDIHKLYLGHERKNRIYDLLDMVGIRKDQLSKYPHEFSGGQNQRICIARALSVNPRLLICDESLSALDLSIQAQIINLLRECQKYLNLSILFISHDKEAVEMIADAIAIIRK